MPGNDAKPVIFLAFANSAARPLASLEVEYNRLMDRLNPAEDQRWEVVDKPFATLPQIFSTFENAAYRDRIAVFHFAGHAAAHELLLRAGDGGDAVAGAGGLISLLGRQHGLQVVFLNACSTETQADGLREAGVPVVIATSQQIKDNVAADFADRFYSALAEGNTIETAYKNAEDFSQSSAGGEPRHLYATDESGQVIATDRWPWSIACRPGAEAALQWHLPLAAGEPATGPTAEPAPQQVRQAIGAKLHDNVLLDAFVSDVYPQLYDEFTSQSGRTQKITWLIQYFNGTGKLAELQAQVDRYAAAY